MDRITLNYNKGFSSEPEENNILTDPKPEYEICEAKNNVNVLLLALSTFNKKTDENNKRVNSVSETKFSYKDYTVTGRYQLDPVPKILSKELHQKGERLDYILCFCTTKGEQGKLLNPQVLIEQEVFVPAVANENGDKHNIKVKVSAFDYFKKQISMYLPDDGERFIPIIIDENAPAKGIETALKKIRSFEKNDYEDKTNNVKLYLDTHGGFRDVQLTLQAVISLLSKGEISIGDNFSVKFGEDHNIITTDKSMDMFDFASGINEFINYGRLSSLDSYIKKNSLDKNAQVNDLMNILKKISDSISICDTKKFEDGLSELTNYFENYNSYAELDILSLFTGTIKTDFGVLLSDNRSVVDEIEWCLKKEYYQQALTLIESKMPGEFVRNGLRYYCDEDNKYIAVSILNEFYSIVPNNQKWMVKDPAHFFIRYYNVLNINNTPIKNIISANHPGNNDYYLNDKSLYSYPDDINDINKLIGSKTTEDSYLWLCEKRNDINHGNGSSISIDTLRSNISNFICNYKNILARDHDEKEIIEIVFNENSHSFGLPLSDLWLYETVPDDTNCSQLELELLKKMIFTFRTYNYPDNRMDFNKSRTDANSLCTGGIPKKSDLHNISPLSILVSKGCGIFQREGNDLIWNPSIIS